MYKIRLQITDLTGKQIFETTQYGMSYTWNTTNINTGLYIYTVFKDNDKIESGKLMIQK